MLVLGGGDGLVVRELLRYPDLGQVTVVDIDPAMTRIARHHAMLRELNGDAFEDPRVKIIHQDAFEFVENASQVYTLVIADLPDPSALDLGKLYTVAFYRLLGGRLAADGVFVTQASSPFFARKAFWCIGATLAESFDHIMPLKSYVPSFGLWGFHLASHAPLRLDRRPMPAELRFLDPDSAIEAGHFPPDISPVDVEPNRLDNQVLVRYYEAAWD